jgi:alpha-glucosidase
METPAGDPQASACRLVGWKADDGGRVQLELSDDAGSGARAEVSIANDGTVRLRAGRSLPLPFETHLGREPWKTTPAVARARDGSGIELAWEGPLGCATVEIEAAPFAVRILDRGGREQASLTGLRCTPDGGARLAWAARPGERLFGFGERNGGLDKRGEKLLFRNRDVHLRVGGSRYLSIPFVLGVVPGDAAGAARGLLLDALGPVEIDAAATRPDTILLETRSDGIDVAFFPGPTPADVARRFTARVGRTPLPPLWALGHHQSRWSYGTASQVRKIAGELRRRRIPTDAIHLDIDYMDGFRVFTWNEKRFPDPKGLLAELEAQGLRTVTIIDPGVKRDESFPVYREGHQRGFFCQKDDGEEFALRVWPGDAALPDFNREDVRTWWGELHRPLIEAGVAGVWNDMNEPAGWRNDLRVGKLPLILRGQDTGELVQSDPREPDRDVPHETVRNVYGLQECRATREFLESARPGVRPFVLTRSGAPGIQRHAAVWTGDNASRWSHLRESIPMLLNLSVSGVPFCGADIGGFSGSCTPELYARWIQLGALYPFSRTHSMVTSRRQEPWSFGPRVEAIARRALELRMRLMPYLYGLFREAEDTGAPVWRPLYWEFPDAPDCAAVEDQLMLGPSLLVAPVVHRGARQREVVLPPGRWLAWDDDAEYVGPRKLRVDAPLERLPLFLRAGALVPSRSPVLHAGEQPAEPCILEVAPGADGAADWIEDDGETTAYREGALARTPLRLWHRAGGRLRLELARREGDLALPRRPMRVVVRGCEAPDAVFLDGRNLAKGGRSPGFTFDQGRVHVIFEDTGQGHVLELEPAP